MKKICWFLLLFAASGVFAQGSHDSHAWFDHHVREAANNRVLPQLDSVKVGFPSTSDTSWSVRGTAKDTSRIYTTSDHAWLGMKWGDSSGDSVNLKIVWWMAPTDQYRPGKCPAFSRFVRIDSTTITRDGSQESMKAVNLYAGPVPPWKYFYLTVEGLTANDKVVGATGIIIMSHWDESFLRP